MQRLSVFHVISGEEQDIPILHGRLDGEKVRVLLRSLVPASSVDHVFICGPTGMSEDIEATCRDIGIAARPYSRRAFRLGARRQAAPESGGGSERAGESYGVADHRRQAPRRAGRRRRIHSRCGAAGRDGFAVRLQGRDVLDLPRQAGRRRCAHGGELFAGALGAQGGIYLDLPGAAAIRTRSRWITIMCNRHCERSEAIQKPQTKTGLLRRCAPRNDGSLTRWQLSS